MSLWPPGKTGPGRCRGKESESGSRAAPPTAGDRVRRTGGQDKERRPVGPRDDPGDAAIEAVYPALSNEHTFAVHWVLCGRVDRQLRHCCWLLKHLVPLPDCINWRYFQCRQVLVVLDIGLLAVQARLRRSSGDLGNLKLDLHLRVPQPLLVRSLDLCVHVLRRRPLRVSPKSTAPDIREQGDPVIWHLLLVYSNHIDYPSLPAGRIPQGHCQII